MMVVLSVIFNWMSADFLQRQKPAFCQNSTFKILNLAQCHTVIENISTKNLEQSNYNRRDRIYYNSMTWYSWLRRKT